MENFSALGLPAPLADALKQQGFEKPTPIQAQAISPALDGKDILGTAGTGTGKTLAFAIPLINHMLLNPDSGAVILTPTRELAAQVAEQVKNLTIGMQGMRCALLIGGDAMPKQLLQLKRRPRIIIGTPGRINDHLDRRTLRLQKSDFLVLDETDRMLDMGFSIQIEEIVKTMHKTRQTLLFSATMPKSIIASAQKYLKEPVHIKIKSDLSANLHQEVFRVKETEKYAHFLQQLQDCTGTAIVFIKTKHGCDKMATRLRKEGFRAEALHGDMRQNARNTVVRKFRNNHFDFLIATDVAARGLDIPHVAHIINYDLPQCPEDYIHRIGRTARAGAKGTATCYVSKATEGQWKAIHRLMNPEEVANNKAAANAKNSGKPARKTNGKAIGKPAKKFGAKPGAKFAAKPKDSKPKDNKVARQDDRPKNKDNTKPKFNAKAGKKGHSPRANPHKGKRRPAATAAA